MMTDLEHPWTRIGWLSFAGIIVISSVLGFVVLSRYQPNEQPLDVWQAICRGLGISFDSAASGGMQPRAQAPTEIAWTQATLDQIRGRNAERGRQIAAPCEGCHGGSAPNPGHLIPTLDGMNAAALFKQLADYRSGKRLGSVMNGMAQALSVQDLADVAAYFAVRAGRLQAKPDERVPPGGHGLRQSDTGARLAFAGDPKRGIAPCSACHGPGGYRTGAPPLAGQYAEYIERQLGSFAQNIRHNDIYEQMRAIARQLTPDEMKAVAGFYGEQSTKVAATP
jgi:cytochrome c553